MARKAVFDEIMDVRGIFSPDLTGPGTFDRLLTNLPLHRFPKVVSGYPLGSATLGVQASLDVNFLTLVVGALILVVISTEDLATVTWPSGGNGTWTAIPNFAANNTTVRVEARWHIHQGTEDYIGPGLINLPFSASVRAAAEAYVITGHGSSTNPPECGTPATGTDANPNPPNLAPSGSNPLVAHRGSVGANQTDPTTNGTFTIPSTVQTGDLLIVTLLTRNCSAIASVTDDDSGGNTWTRLVALDAGDGLTHHTWYKFATSGTASKTVSWTSDAGCSIGVLSAYSDAFAATAMQNPSVESNASGDETHAGFVPAFADSMICLTTINPNISSAVTVPSTANPGALTSRAEDFSTGGGFNIGVMHASARQSGGPTSTGTFSWAQVNAASESIVYSIRPAVGARKNYLWLAVMGADGDDPVTTWPTAYTGIAEASNFATPDGISCAVAQRNGFWTSEDPPRFIMSGADEWIANTIVIYPGTEGDPQLAADPLVFTLSLIDAALQHGYKFSADPLVYAVSLQDASVLAQRSLSADPLVYTYSLQAATLLRAALLSADPMAFAVALQSATLAHGYVLVADPLAFVVSLQTAATLVARMIAADPLAYSYSLQSAALLAARLMTADPITYAVSLQGATLLRDALLKADPLGYAVSLQSATLIRDAILKADPIPYIVALSDADLAKSATNTLPADPLVFQVTLSDAGLIYTPVTGAGGFGQLLKRRRR